MPPSLDEPNVDEFVDSIFKNHLDHRLLTASEERKLLEQVHGADLELARRAEDILCHHNFRLVWSIVSRYQARVALLPDLVQEGQIGLLHAIRKFDLDRDIRLSTYATHWIRQGIQRSFDRLDRTIRLPIHGCYPEQKLAKHEELLFIELGRAPTVDELARASGFSRYVVTALLSQNFVVNSLDHLTNEEDGTPLHDLVADPFAIDPQENSLLQDQLEQVRSAMGLVLTPVEREVLGDSYLRGPDCMTLRQCAKAHGYSAEGIRHVLIRAVRKIQRYLDGHENG